MPPDYDDDDAHRRTRTLQSTHTQNYGSTSDATEQQQQQPQPEQPEQASIDAPASQSSARCSPPPAAVSSDRQLLAAIFALTGPISLTTVVECQ